MAGDVFLPTVAISHSDWTRRIYQFVVINEKAQKVDSETLNDIFASSLTPTEQAAMREGFVRVKVDIQERIAGVIAGRDKESPFYQMVTLNLPNPPASEASAYISQKIIQSLIEGGRGSRGCAGIMYADDNNGRFARNEPTAAASKDSWIQGDMSDNTGTYGQVTAGVFDSTKTNFASNSARSGRTDDTPGDLPLPFRPRPARQHSRSRHCFDEWLDWAPRARKVLGPATICGGPV